MIQFLISNISQFLALSIGTYSKWPHPVTNYQMAFWLVVHGRFHSTDVFQNLCGKLFCDFSWWIIVTGFYILLWCCCILGEPKSRPKGYVPQGTFYSSLLGSACPKGHKKGFLYWASVINFVSSIHRSSFSILFPHWYSTTVIPSYIEEHHFCHFYLLPVKIQVKSHPWLTAIYHVLHSFRSFMGLKTR